MEKVEAKESCPDCETGHSAKASKSRKPLPPNHSASKTRINRVKGQLDAVSRMIDERAYCPDILQQVRAATNALRGLEAEILRGHLRGCVKKAFQTKNTSDANDKIEEILKMWNR